jgi:hypothetical protein
MLSLFSVKFVLSSLFVAVIMSIVASGLMYKISIDEMEKLLSEKLNSIAINSVIEIDAKNHDQLVKHYLALNLNIYKTKEFIKLKTRLNKIFKKITLLVRSKPLFCLNGTIK